MKHPAVAAFDVWKSYSEDHREDLSALAGVDLAVDAGQIVALYGKSGSGKTTLLNLLAGLDRPTRGRIEVDGRDLSLIGESGRTELRRRRLGFVFQFFNLLPTLTVEENVMLSLELAGRPDLPRARRALADVGLGGMGKRYPHELSGGEQQRVAVARAIVKEPVLILADEPTGNLDTATGDHVLNLLASRCRRNSTALIIATHALRAERWADRILRITDGRIQHERESKP